MGYDAWLEGPYQRAAEEAERLRCPKCDEQMEEDTHDQSVTCRECGFSDGVDWDAVAEARAEARADDDPGRDVW